MSLPFTGIATFAKVPPYDPHHPQVPHAVILGIPWDGGTTNVSGARLGPRAIPEASTQDAFSTRGRGYHDLAADRPMLAALDEAFARIGEGVRALAARFGGPAAG